MAGNFGNGFGELQNQGELNLIGDGALNTSNTDFAVLNRASGTIIRDAAGSSGVFSIQVTLFQDAGAMTDIRNGVLRLTQGGRTEGEFKVGQLQLWGQSRSYSLSFSSATFSGNGIVEVGSNIEASDLIVGLETVTFDVGSPDGSTGHFALIRGSITGGTDGHAINNGRFSWARRHHRISSRNGRVCQ